MWAHIVAGVSGVLGGFTVGVTAARRGEEFAQLLRRRGAEVISAPAIEIVPLADDTELVAATRALIDEPPQVVVVTTGVGFRGWWEAAAGWGLTEQLRTVLGGARVLARGPKAVGAIRGAGLREYWSPESESSAQVRDRLLAEGIEGVRIAVQLHGETTEWEPLPDLCAALRTAGADVVPIPVYRWQPPPDPAPMDHLIDAVISGNVDCLTFTSAPAVASLLTRSQQTQRLEAVLAALRGPVLAAGVGPITAGPLTRLEIPVTIPDRSRLAALVRHLETRLPRHAARLSEIQNDSVATEFTAENTIGKTP